MTAVVRRDAVGWLNRRVRIFAAWDVHKTSTPIVEGVVVAYAGSPTITVRSDDGGQSNWMVKLPIDVLEEYADIPPEAVSATADDLVTFLQGRRRDALRALRACIAGNTDYWRWQGHAELSRQLLERLGAEIPQ